MKAVALIANLDKPNAGSVARRICAWLKARNIAVWAQEELLCGDARFRFGEPLPAVDLVLVLGGDGTFLNVARRYTGAGIPFLGVNLGRLGFLTEVEVGELDSALEKVYAGQYTIERRAMLCVQVCRRGKVVEETCALNEATIAKGPLARIIRLDVCVDNVPIGSYNGDGLIVSTPTGSTGYSLSAGGPIVASNVDLLLITPICPHTLSARPIAVARNAVIDVTLMSVQPEIVLTVDGQHSFSLEYGDRLTITDAKVETLLLRLQGKNFFEILRKKLKEQKR